MCGIVGILASTSQSEARLIDTVRTMADTLAHRGPDANGLWVDPEAGLALGHRRLSILELSSLGNQPMVSSCGRYVLCHNGEVYNHLELRQELEQDGYSFSGTSDTETMLATIAHWGLRNAVKRFIGMFAFALWDKDKKQLHLVRDRLGIKPLYFGRAGGNFVFGSEIGRAHL